MLFVEIISAVVLALNVGVVHISVCR